MALALAVRDELRHTERLRARRAAPSSTVFDLTMRKLPPPATDAARLRSRVHLLLPQRGDGERTRDFPCRQPSCARGRDQPSSPASAIGAMRVASQRARCRRQPPCPLLHDNLCSVYSARPAVCRKHTSFSVDACIADYEGRGGEIPIRRFDQQIFECCAVALLTGHAAVGRAARRRLRAVGALRVALQDAACRDRSGSPARMCSPPSPARSKLPGIDEHAAFLWGVSREIPREAAAPRLCARPLPIRG